MENIHLSRKAHRTVDDVQSVIDELIAEIEQLEETIDELRQKLEDNETKNN